MHTNCIAIYKLTMEREPVSYKVLKNCHLATMLANGTPYGLIKDAVIVLKNDRIIWSGQATDAPQKYQVPNTLMSKAG